MKDFTFLTEEQVFGDKQLDILKKYGTKCLKQENLKKNIQVKL